LPNRLAYKKSKYIGEGKSTHGKGKDRRWVGVWEREKATPIFWEVPIVPVVRAALARRDHQETKGEKAWGRGNKKKRPGEQGGVREGQNKSSHKVNI